MSSIATRSCAATATSPSAGLPNSGLGAGSRRKGTSTDLPRARHGDRELPRRETAGTPPPAAHRLAPETWDRIRRAVSARLSPRVCRPYGAMGGFLGFLPGAAAPSSLWVAVGTPVARRPPHRSQRAELPHWAPALGSDAQTLVWMRMSDLRIGQPPVGQTGHPLPSDLVLLAAAPKRHTPVPPHLVAE